LLFVINPYIYPNNDPINFIDPYGLCGERRRGAIEDIASRFGVPTPFLVGSLAISQADTPAPGLADIIAIGVLVAGVIYYAIKGPSPERYPGENKSKRRYPPLLRKKGPGSPLQPIRLPEAPGGKGWKPPEGPRPGRKWGFIIWKILELITQFTRFWNKK